MSENRDCHDDAQRELRRRNHERFVVELVTLKQRIHVDAEHQGGDPHHHHLSDNPDKRAALIELIPAGRFGTLREVVDPVLFLCSSHASFITGQVLYIDGGRTIV